MTQRYPDFIVAGVRKCGTTWLDRCLREHPGVFMPADTKELFFFDRYWSRGAEWYADYFAQCGRDQLCGEVSPTYFTEPKAPERIRGLMPNAKLIFVFRHPVRRAVSLYHHMRARGDTSLSFAEAIEKLPELLEEGFYARHFARFVNAFPAANIKTLILDDIEADPAVQFESLFTFIGADPSFRPPTLARRSYARREARSRSLARLASETSRQLHSMGLHRVVTLVKSTGVEKLVLRKPKAASDSLDPAIAARLYALYDPEIGELGRMIGRNLRQVWTLEQALTGGEAESRE